MFKDCIYFRIFKIQGEKMGKKEDLLEKFQQASSLEEYVDLCKIALKEPPEEELAVEILNTAIDECKFTSDFIKLAELYAVIGNREKALEIFEEAENNAFEPKEFADIGISVLKSLNEIDRANELLFKAANSSKKETDLILILKNVSEEFPNSNVISILIDKLIEMCKSIDDFKNLVEKIKKNVDTPILKSFFESFELKLQSIEESISFANLIEEYFSDKEWSTKIIEECAKDAKFCKEFIEIAKYYNLNSKQAETKAMLEYAKEYAISLDENLAVAFAFWEIFRDTQTTKKFIEKSLKNINDKKELIKLAEFSNKQLSDKDLTQEILDLIETKSNSLSDFIELINLYSDFVGEQDKIVKLYSNFFERIIEPKDLVFLGKDLAQRTSMPESSKIFFLKAMKNSTNLDQLLFIAETSTELGLKDLTFEALFKSESLAKTSSDFLQLGEKYISLLSEKEKAKFCFELAEELVASVSDMKLVTELVSKYFADNIEWNQRINDKLRKRKERQAEYDGFQKQENELKFFLNYLKLADNIMIELNDIDYCRKILKKAESYLLNQPLNLDNYSQLARSIIKHTSDENWVRELFLNLLNNKIKFIFELDYLCETFLEIISDKHFVLTQIELFLKEFLKQKLNPNDLLKLAKVAFKYNILNNEILQLINYSLHKCDVYALIEYLKFSNSFWISELFDQIKIELIGKIYNAKELIVVALNFISLGISENELSNIIANFIAKTDDEEELYTIAENLLVLLQNKAITLTLLSQIQMKVQKSKDNVLKIRNMIKEGKYW